MTTQKAEDVRPKKGLRWHWRNLGGWGAADYLGHHWPCPERIRHWFCDQFDRSLGVFDDDEDDEQSDGEV